jgi:hypothetical protein
MTRRNCIAVGCCGGGAILRQNAKFELPPMASRSLPWIQFAVSDSGSQTWNRVSPGLEVTWMFP